MIRLLKFLWSGCFHVWEDTGQGEFEKGSARGNIVFSRCVKCGAHTNWEHAKMKKDDPL